MDNKKDIYGFVSVSEKLLEESIQSEYRDIIKMLEPVVDKNIGVSRKNDLNILVYTRKLLADALCDDDTYSSVV